MDPLSHAMSALEEDRALSAESDDGTGHVPARTRVVLLPEPQLDARGVLYRRSEGLYLLPWSRVSGAHAAEVGEPEGVRTVVFDLSLTGREHVRCRLDADPGDSARELGQAIERGLGRGQCTKSLRAVALDGYATRSYPDLESFEEDAQVELLRSA